MTATRKYMTTDKFESDAAVTQQLSFNALDSSPSAKESDGLAVSQTVLCAAPPLVVDMDGTLILTDTLVESFLVMLKSGSIAAVAAVCQLVKGRAQFKQFVAERSQLNVSTLPYRADLLNYITEERNKGRRTVLATAAYGDIAQAVANHLQLFDDVIASDGTVNLKGEKKLGAIRSLVGEILSMLGIAPQTFLYGLPHVR
jgi:hypothetical protein